MPEAASFATWRTTSAAEGKPLTWSGTAKLVSALVLMVTDLVAMLLAAAAVSLVCIAFWRAGPLLWTMYAAGLGWMLFRAVAGLYPPFGISQPEELRRSFLTTMAAGFVHLALVEAIFGLDGWRLAGLGIWLVLVPTSYFCRSLMKVALIRRQLFGQPCVVIGTGEKARRIIREMKANPELGQIPVAVFGDRSELWGCELEGVPVLGPSAMALGYAYPYPVRCAIIAVPSSEMIGPECGDLIERLSRCYPTLQVLSSLGGMSNLWVQTRLIGPYLALEMKNSRLSASQKTAKRIFDVIVTAPVLLAAAPIVGIAALLVRCIDPGPAFFSQVREGIYGQPIRIWKIRTMVVGAERRLAEYLASNPGARFEYERTLKLRQDPRVIPKVGRFLRRYSIDELPQLWNVLKGDLSLIGPRVMLGHEVNRFTGKGQELRRDVPPGLTGLWQVLHRNNSDLQIWEFADSYYVNNWSVWLDGWILMRTVRVVLTGAGAF